MRRIGMLVSSRPLILPAIRRNTDQQSIRHNAIRNLRQLLIKIAPSVGELTIGLPKLLRTYPILGTE